MRKHSLIYLFVSLLVFTLTGESFAKSTPYRVLLIHSYNQESSWDNQLTAAVSSAFDQVGVKVRLSNEYLDTDCWLPSAQKALMKRFCQRGEQRGTDLIMVTGEEALNALLTCDDSLPQKTPIIFLGVKYPNQSLLKGKANVTGVVSAASYLELLEKAHALFPDRKEVVCLVNTDFQSSKDMDAFGYQWTLFAEKHPDYRLNICNTEKRKTDHLVNMLCRYRNAGHRVVIVPKWSSFFSFLGKNAKAPFFVCQSEALTNGVLCAYDAGINETAFLAAQKAVNIFKGFSPHLLGFQGPAPKFHYDYKQLDFFHVDADCVNENDVLLNEPYWTKFSLILMALFAFVILALTAYIVWLVRINRRESRRRIHAQMRLLVQNRLVEQRNEFDKVFHSIRDGVVTFDLDFKICFINRAFIELLHWTKAQEEVLSDQAVSNLFFEIIHEDKDILSDLLRSVIDRAKNIPIPPHSFMKDFYSNNYFPISGEVVPLFSREKISGMVLSVRNISDEEVQKRFFDMAVEQNAIYPWQYKVSMDSFVFSQHFLLSLGYTASDAVISRTDLLHYLHPDDVEGVDRFFKTMVLGECNCVPLNLRFMMINGGYEWWEFRFSIIKGLAAHSPYSILGVCQNVHRYKTTELELREARDKAMQADKLKSAFLANMSHEIRTPLNAIVGFSDLLTDASEFSDAEIAQFISTINKNCSLLLTLINDILDLSRIESGTMEFLVSEHSLPLLLRNIYDSQRYAMPSGVQLLLKMPEDVSKRIITDSVRLQQVLNNLINNAAKFTSSGTITLGYEADPEAGYTRLFVEDTGLGISPENLEHIFDRFYKVDSFTQGAGLGLSICQTIVERLQGSIAVTSELGKGTRFVVRIPDESESL